MEFAYVTQAAANGARGQIDRLLADVVARLEQRRLRLAGTVQTNVENPGRPCAMDLKILPHGPILRISEDRGALARGCRLDAGALEQAVPAIERALEGAQLVILNKFGKQEARGHGLVGVLAEALSRQLPVLVGVNGWNLPAFLSFADGLATALPADPDAILRWCEAAVGAGARNAA